jgi:Flp pilus assembly protein TadD
LLDLLRGDPAAAEREARALLASGPRHRNVYELLAYALTAQGRFAEAEPVARRVVAMRPNRTAQSLLAFVLIESGDADQGQELAEQALEFRESWQDPLAELLPFVVTPEQALGLAHLARGDHRRAVDRLEEAARRRPDNPSIQEQLARARAAL